MKKLFTILFSLGVLVASAQFQSEAFIKQQEKLYNRYTGQQTWSIVTGTVSGLSFIGWGITYTFKPEYTYTGTNQFIAEAQRIEYEDNLQKWKNARMGLLISGGATGVTSIILGLCSAKNKHLYDTNKMTLRFTPNNGIGLCLQFKAY